MGSIFDNSAIQLEDLKKHLRIEKEDKTEDDQLQRMLDAVKKKADKTCNNPFLESDGVTDRDIPEDVEMWILQVCERLYNFRANGLFQETVTGLGTVVWSKMDFTLLQSEIYSPGT